ncbi:MAG: alpha/beta hydrolase family protein, partial [Vicinamibacteria bacterium]
MPPSPSLLERAVDALFRSTPWRGAIRAVSVTTELDPPARAAETGPPPPELNYDRKPIPAKIVEQIDHSRFREIQLQFPPRDERAWGYPSRASYRTPKSSAPPWPGVLVLPLYYDKRNLIGRRFAEYLAARGYATFQFRSRRRFLEGVRLNETGSGPGAVDIAREMILDARRAADWLGDQPEIDGRRLAVVGTSHGAMIGVCAMGVDSRFQAGAFILAGGNLPKILITSVERGLRSFRQRLMKANGIATLEELARRHAAETESIEPVRYARRIDPRNVFLVKSTRDRGIIPQAQDELWEALGRHRRFIVQLWQVT